MKRVEEFHSKDKRRTAFSLHQLSDKPGIASSLHQLGMIRQEKGDYEEAEKLYNESLAIKKDLKQFNN